LSVRDAIYGILICVGVVLFVYIWFYIEKIRNENSHIRYTNMLKRKEFDKKIKELAKKRKPKAQQIYNDEFLAIRTDVLKRDNYTCVNCGQTGGELHVHHILARAEGGTNDLTNLVSLCASCHSVQDAKGHELIQEDEIEEDTAFGMPIDMLEE